MGYYIIKFIYDTVTLQEENNTCGKVFKAGELASKYELDNFNLYIPWASILPDTI